MLPVAVALFLVGAVLAYLIARRQDRLAGVGKPIMDDAKAGARIAGTFALWGVILFVFGSVMGSFAR